MFLLTFIINRNCIKLNEYRANTFLGNHSTITKEFLKIFFSYSYLLMFSLVWSNSNWIKYTTLCINVKVWPKTEECMSSVQNFYTKSSKVIRFLTFERIMETNIIGIWTSAVISFAEPVIRITFWKTSVSSKNIFIIVSGQQGLLSFEISCKLYDKISYSSSWYWGRSNIVKVTNWCCSIFL